MKFKDRFFIYPNSTEEYGIKLEIRRGDWAYLDIYFGLKFIFILLKDLRKKGKTK